MQKPCKRGLALICVLSSIAATGSAESIREINYLHSNPSNQLWPGRWFDPGYRFVQQSGERGVEVRGKQRVWSDGSRMNIEPNFHHPKAIVFKFDQKTCAVGAKVTIESNGKHNSVPIIFEFFDEIGQSLGKQERRPASGTTRQAYASTTFETGFFAFQVSSTEKNLSRVGEVWAQPCLDQIS